MSWLAKISLGIGFGINAVLGFLHLPHSENISVPTFSTPVNNSVSVPDSSPISPPSQNTQTQQPASNAGSSQTVNTKSVTTVNPPPAQPSQTHAANENSVVTPVPPTVPSSSSLLTYNNSDYGFSIQYPSDFHIYGASSHASPTGFVTVSITPDINTPNLHAELKLYVEVSKTPTDIARCSGVPQPLSTREQTVDTGAVNINGNQFVSYKDVFPNVTSYNYSLLQNGACFLMELESTPFSITIPQTDAQKKIADTTYNQMFAALKEVVYSFTFTQ